jgi:competence protein ComEC
MSPVRALLLSLVAALLVACGGAATAREPEQPKVTGPAMRVHLINVGQGASTLIEFSCAAMLVDTGGEEDYDFDSTKRLQKYLDGFFERRPELKRTLALMVITHPHIDHDRNAMMVWKNYHVLNLVTDGLTPTLIGGPEQAALIAAAQQSGAGVRAIAVKDVPPGGLSDTVIDPVACADGDPDIRVLWGAVAREDVKWPDPAFANANNHSVVTKVTLGRSSILITGDLELDGIAAMLAHAAGNDSLMATVYEVGHHGSYNATTKELLDAITPQLALIAVGSTKRNIKEKYTALQYGHPRNSTIDLLQKAVTGRPRGEVTVQVGDGPRNFERRTMTSPIYATAWDGNVAVTLGADGTYSVVFQRER